jgi:signal transduction histidine kinase
MDRKRLKTELLIHDLKNPLSVIEASIVSLVQGEDKYGALSEKQKKILQRTLRNTKIIKGLVGDILEVGRSREGVIFKKSVAVSDLIRWVFVEIFDITEPLTAEQIKGCRDLSQLTNILYPNGILLKITENVWSQEITLDEHKVRQILRNLLNNAIKHRKKSIELTIEIKDKVLFFSIKDDGEGIDKAYHQKIFDCYFQLDQERDQCIRGHGLGLAGALILVEDMGGVMSLESDVGQGAAFFVKLPLAP